MGQLSRQILWKGSNLLVPAVPAAGGCLLVVHTTPGETADVLFCPLHGTHKVNKVATVDTYGSTSVRISDTHLQVVDKVINLVTFEVDDLADDRFYFHFYSDVRADARFHVVSDGVQLVTTDTTVELLTEQKTKSHGKKRVWVEANLKAAKKLKALSA